MADPNRTQRGITLVEAVIVAALVPIVLTGAIMALRSSTVVQTDVGSAVDNTRKLRTVLRAIVRRPRLQVHVGPPVRLDDLEVGRIGDANRARYRITAAITRGLVPLRAGEMDAPAFAAT